MSFLAMTTWGFSQQSQTESVDRLAMTVGEERGAEDQAVSAIRSELHQEQDGPAEVRLRAGVAGSDFPGHDVRRERHHAEARG